MWSAQRRSLHLPALIALKNNINIENCSFCMSSLFNFSSIFPEGQLTPFAPVCGRPWTFVCVCVCSAAADEYGLRVCFDERGDSKGRYNIMNYRRNRATRRYEYVTVGRWADGLSMDIVDHGSVDRITWAGGTRPNARATTDTRTTRYLPRLCQPSVGVYKKLSYRRGTARCVVSIEILPIATQQCRNYLYDKS